MKRQTLPSVLVTPVCVNSLLQVPRGHLLPAHGGKHYLLEHFPGKITEGDGAFYYEVQPNDLFRVISVTTSDSRHPDTILAVRMTSPHYNYSETELHVVLHFRASAQKHYDRNIRLGLGDVLLVGSLRDTRGYTFSMVYPGDFDRRAMHLHGRFTPADLKMPPQAEASPKLYYVGKGCLYSDWNRAAKICPRGATISHIRYNGLVGEIGFPDKVYFTGGEAFHPEHPDVGGELVPVLGKGVPPIPEGWELEHLLCIVCPDCAFAYAVEHEDSHGGYTCPNCGLYKFPPPEALQELAATEHKRWSGWMKHLFSKGAYNDDGTWTMPEWGVREWTRQMETAYPDLSDKEKDADIREVLKTLAVLEKHVNKGRGR